MKKLAIVLLIAVMLVTLCACNYVPSTRFMPKSQVKSLVKRYERPQAEMTFHYTADNMDVEVKVVYDLLLDKTPLATVRFIQLVNEGFYNDTFFDYYNGPSQYNYLTLGRYLEKKSIVSDKTVYLKNPSETTFKGEFKSNGYKEPEGGYAQFGILSLAMYHDAWTEDNNTFDTACGYLIMSTSTKTLNSDNYAVFAHLSSMSVRYDDGTPIVQNNVRGEVLKVLTASNNATSRTVYDDESETNSSSVSMKRDVIKVEFKILGDYDWSKLPQIGK